MWRVVAGIPLIVYGPRGVFEWDGIKKKYLYDTISIVNIIEIYKGFGLHEIQLPANNKHVRIQQYWNRVRTA